jgi:hypothetical protein
MVSGFGRNVKKFAVNRYMEIRPVTKTKGFYLRWKSEQAGRVRYTDLSDMEWPDNSERPRGEDNLEQFEFEPYTTTRYAKSFTIGELTLDMADWPLHEYQTQQIAQQMMTGRTVLVSNFLNGATWNTNQANVDGTYGTLNGNAALLGAGHNWSNGTSQNPYIKASFQAALNIINKVTLAGLDFEDMACVLTPDTAIPMSQSQEVNDIMARSIYALPNLTGQLWFNKEWALPDELYGVRLIIDRTPYINNAKLGGGSISPLSAYGYPIQTGTAYFLTCPKATNAKGDVVPKVSPNRRKGMESEDQDGNKAAYFPVLSTLVGFFQEEFTIEAMKFPWDRLVAGSVVSNFDLQLTSWKSGFQFQKCLG